MGAVAIGGEKWWSFRNLCEGVSRREIVRNSLRCRNREIRTCVETTRSGNQGHDENRTSSPGPSGGRPERWDRDKSAKDDFAGRIEVFDSMNSKPNYRRMRRFVKALNSVGEYANSIQAELTAQSEQSSLAAARLDGWISLNDDDDDDSTSSWLSVYSDASPGSPEKPFRAS